MAKYDILRKLYENLATPTGYSKPSNLLKYAKKEDADIMKQDVKSFLKKQEGFTRHGTVPRSFMHRPIKISSAGNTLGSDLIDMGNQLREDNSGYRYILVLIDCFSRKLDLLPLRKK